MGKKSRELEILNERRLALKENVEAFEHERDRLKRRLNIILDHIDAAENELGAIDVQLTDIARNENLDVKLHIVHGEYDTNRPKCIF